MIDTDRVQVTSVVRAPPDEAFRVFTEEIGAWWWRGKDLGTGRAPRRGTLRFEAGPTGRLLEEYPDGDAFCVGRILRWVPAQQLVFEFRQGNFEGEQVTEVEVRFEPDPEGTRVSLEHRGFDALPPDHGARHGLEGEAFKALWGVFWADHVSALRQRIDLA